MAIDTSGQWWVGSEASDVLEYLDGYSAQSYRAGTLVLARCTCGSERFQLRADRREGAAQRVCADCGRASLIGDSADSWSAAKPKRWKCFECGGDTCNVGVGFSTYEDQDAVQWLYVGCRCDRCGVLGCFVDWKVGSGPAAEIISKA